MSRPLSRLAARAVRLTYSIDRAYQRFDRLRSLLVLGFASRGFFEEYNDLAFGSSSRFHADSRDFHRGLYAWEEEAVRRFFPRPPARVLVGGAGGGREAAALVEMGYSVLAFDPAQHMVASLRKQAAALREGMLIVHRARYEDLPVLPPSPASMGVDLRTLPLFDAAIAGWGSFSHLLEDETRVKLLEQFRSLTRGPILISFFWTPTSPGPPRGFFRRRANRRGHGVFAPATGYGRFLTEADIRMLAGATEMDVLHLATQDTTPHAVLKRID